MWDSCRCCFLARSVAAEYPSDSQRSGVTVCYGKQTWIEMPYTVKPLFLNPWTHFKR